MEHDLPLAQEHDLVKDLLDVGDQVRGDDDRCVLAVVADDRAQDIVARRGVPAADRLVEQLELRSAAHGKHELDLFLHALGHLTDGLVEIQTELREHPVIISTHLIADVEPVLDDVIFLDHGHVALHESCEEIRETRGQSVDALFREVFKCWEN